MATQVLWCETGEHNWTKTASRGRPPKACEEHASLKPKRREKVVNPSAEAFVPNFPSVLDQETVEAWKALQNQSPLFPVHVVIEDRDYKRMELIEVVGNALRDAGFGLGAQKFSTAGHLAPTMDDLLSLCQQTVDLKIKSGSADF